ncbi:MAG: hypothetical protein QF389_02100 [Planctomycetota bacterium]|jgi:hypothetical protein|nr:hypothetical protein [Planctomycetota bacterium]
MKELKAKGACHCGAIQYLVCGEVMVNGLCHCPNCTRSKGVSPVHLITLCGENSVEIMQGDELLQTRALDKFHLVTCKMCHGPVMQYQEGMGFRAVFPVSLNLRRGNAGPDHGADRIPDEWKPQLHLNYENRLFDWDDDLPKFKVFPPDNPLKSDGTPLES